MVTYDELGCSRTERAIKKLVERTIHILKTTYGLDPTILLRCVDKVVKEILPDDTNIYDVSCRSIVVRRVREYLNNFHGGTLPSQLKTDWTRISALAAIATAIITIIYLFIK